ncbi:unnamed protein product, partial [Heterosigma akashiwo]
LSDLNPLYTLGRGLFGKVVVARKLRRSGRHELFAIKEVVCTKASEVRVVRRERLVMERIMKSPSHFTTQLKFAVCRGNKAHFVMEFCPGGDLYHALGTNTIGFNGARFYAAEVLEALRFLHSQKVVYRDLKPENILLDADGHIKLADFGLSRILDDQDGRLDLATTVTGTAAYLAPEMFSRQYRTSVDYWQYGCLVYELFTGKSPFYLPELSGSEMKEKILAADFQFPSNCSRRWQQLISQLLVPKVSERLGFRDGDDRWAAVQRMPFFDGVRWDYVSNLKYAPPIQPQRPGQDFTTNFDQEFLSEDPALELRESSPDEAGAQMPLVEEQECSLVGFDYIPP